MNKKELVLARKKLNEQRPLFEKFTWRVRLLLGRQYLWGVLTKPLNELTDLELLAVKGIGVKTLDEVRKIIPRPSGTVGTVISRN